MQEEQLERTFDNNHVSVEVDSVGILNGGKLYHDAIVAKLSFWVKRTKNNVTHGESAMAEILHDGSLFIELGWGIDSDTHQIDTDYYVELNDFLHKEFSDVIREAIIRFIYKELGAEHPDFVRLATILDLLE